MKQRRIIVLGKDPRQEYLCKKLNELGHLSSYHPQEDFEDLNLTDRAMCVVFPLFPPLRLLSHTIGHCQAHALLCAGLPSQEFILFAKEYGFQIYDYMSDPEIAQKNAVATAEGAIAEGLRLSKITLQGSNSLVIGYGLCGEIIAEKCKLLGSNVTVWDKDRFKLAHAYAHGFQAFLQTNDLSPFTYLFNTAPAPILTDPLIETIPEDGIIIDIASSPGGTDFDQCMAKKIPAKLCPSLPAIYAPKTSGDILATAICRRLNEFIY